MKIKSSSGFNIFSEGAELCGSFSIFDFAKVFTDFPTSPASTDCPLIQISDSGFFLLLFILLRSDTKNFGTPLGLATT
ncbi:hypothetical protein [Endozoicomonas atrinae]|uniref:hypothetical protein n=1 Tax=Endozoicomonas atrinae TaxID=1333660 RepID=UPI001586C938|nr:hypothetical protein [Endozoicomonas atrinae]